ncbi:Hypothetical protein ORPV_168 [Orpheovirus IHUMI-LCC2]|uniref:Uncharacterized protein n=1 Tax=Orpheovirus IHUMI-LCC2 TaxID=2023057 RepID=A0A2I2L3F6_9VIRU|nr:Hypothetical protein ORPV_168 [Orpheovirus IHUMI-LCC2]SNW62072.1 Hypothetical protein ORPV_168 [Orpheovirus IHUMI-LCC2]
MNFKLPPSILLNASGTRRYVYLKCGNLSPDQYINEMVNFTIKSIKLLYEKGAKYIFSPITVANEDKEVGRTSLVRVQMVEKAIRKFSQEYLKNNIRIHVAGDDYINLSSLRDCVNKYNELLENDNNNHLILFCNLYTEHSYNKLIEMTSQGIGGLDELKLSWYNTLPIDIPPISLRLAFGKPCYGHDLYPFLMTDRTIHDYFYQTLGYPSEDDINRIIDDYNKIRMVWREDKSKGYVEQEDYSWWSRPLLPILGLGKRIGHFWTPI